MELIKLCRTKKSKLVSKVNKSFGTDPMDEKN